METAALFRASSCLVCGRGRSGDVTANAACSGNLGIKNPSLFCALDWFQRGRGRSTRDEGRNILFHCKIAARRWKFGGNSVRGRKEREDKPSCPRYKSFLRDTDLPRSVLCDNIRQQSGEEKAFHASTDTDDNEAVRRVEISRRRVG